MAGDSGVEKIDETLARRLLTLSRSSQRWLKTALQTVRTMPAAPHEAEVQMEDLPPAVAPAPEPVKAAPADLEDVITGRADLEETLESYPELAGEMEGLGDIIDMLRDMGSQRRKRGSDILREEILGGMKEGRGEVDDDEDDFLR